MLLVVQFGGAIAFKGSGIRADLTLCTLSSNGAKQVRGHAISAVLTYWCIHVRGVRKRGKITLAVWLVSKEAPSPSRTATTG